MRRFREMKQPDWDQIEDDLESWGYFREIEPWEWGVSIWMRWGPDVIFWYNRASNNGEPQALALHIARAPMSLIQLRKLDTSRFFHGVEVIAEILDAQKLVAILSRDACNLRRHLSKRGWTEEGDWMVKSLEGI